LLTVLVGRTLKKDLESVWRKVMDDVSLPADEPFVSPLCLYLNLITGFVSDQKWRSVLKEKLCSKFVGVLNDEELQSSFDVVEAVDLRYLMFYLTQVCGFTLEVDVCEYFFANPAQYQFFQSDIIHLVPVFKKSFLFHVWDGVSKFLIGKNLKQQEVSHRLLKSGLHILSSALARIPRCPFNTLLTGSAALKTGNSAATSKSKAQYYRLAIQNLEYSVQFSNSFCTMASQRWLAPLRNLNESLTRLIEVEKENDAQPEVIVELEKKLQTNQAAVQDTQHSLDGGLFHRFGAIVSED